MDQPKFQTAEMKIPLPERIKDLEAKVAVRDAELEKWRRFYAALPENITMEGVESPTCLYDMTDCDGSHCADRAEMYDRYIAEKYTAKDAIARSVGLEVE